MSERRLQNHQARTAEHPVRQHHAAAGGAPRPAARATRPATPRTAPAASHAIPAGRTARGGSGANAAATGHAPASPTVPPLAGTTSGATRRRSRYIPALDGIRTLAVLAVVFYHLNFTWAQGGFLGVTIFFVLSGYLITRLLLAEFEQSDRIDLKSFWVRRVRRLVPATITLIVVVALLCTIFNHVMLTKMRPDILPSLFFFNNWWQIAQNVSYFDALGDPSPLTHFWSLAIEEQFYVVWPVLLFILLKLRVKRPIIRRIVVALAAASAIAMAVLYDPAADPSRVYYGTDTRAFSMLLGAWLAFIPERSMHPAQLVRELGLNKFVARFMPSKPLDNATAPQAEAGGPVASTDAPSATPGATAATGTPASSADTPGAAASVAAPGAATAATPAATSSPASAPRGALSQHILDIAGVASLIGLVLLTVFSNGYTPFMYRGGTVLCSVLGVILIAACVQPTGLLARAFAAKPLVWLGKRSYSIYLWHYPLLALMNPVSNIAETPWWMYLVQLAVVLLAAELSYHFIETPFRHGALGSFVRQVRGGQTSVPAFARAHVIPVALAGVVTLAALGGIVFVPSTSALSKEGAELIQQNAEDNADDAAASTNNTTASTSEAAGDATDADDDGFPDSAYDILMIGDSVSLRTVDTFNSTFPHGHIDAAKNRQFAAGKELFQSYDQQHLAGKVVVFALGTNGPVTDDAIDRLMEAVGTKRVCVFITTRSPRQWVQSTNEALERAADRYDNVRVIDWYSYSAGRNDLFDGDGTHLSADGAKEYISLVQNEVKDDLPFHMEGDALKTATQNVLDHAQAISDQVAPALLNRGKDGSNKTS